MHPLVSALDLQPNIEGGYYRQTFESAARVEIAIQRTERGVQAIDAPLGYFHRNRHDITHFHHMGGAARYLLISAAGDFEQITLGPNHAAGQRPCFTAPGGWWKSSHLAPGADFCLISEAVSPGFDYADHEMATLKGFAADFPHLLDRVRDHVRP